MTKTTSAFPINTAFGPDWRSNIDAFNKFVGDPNNYRDFQFQPYRMFEYIQDLLSIVMNELPTGEKKPFRKLDEGDLNDGDSTKATAALIRSSVT